MTASKPGEFTARKAASRQYNGDLTDFGLACFRGHSQVPCTLYWAIMAPIVDGAKLQNLRRLVSATKINWSTVSLADGCSKNMAIKCIGRREKSFSVGCTSPLRWLLNQDVSKMCVLDMESRIAAPYTTELVSDLTCRRSANGVNRDDEFRRANRSLSTVGLCAETGHSGTLHNEYHQKFCKIATARLDTVAQMTLEAMYKSRCCPSCAAKGGRRGKCARARIACRAKSTSSFSDLLALHYNVSALETTGAKKIHAIESEVLKRAVAGNLFRTVAYLRKFISVTHPLVRTEVLDAITSNTPCSGFDFILERNVGSRFNARLSGCKFDHLANELYTIPAPMTSVKTLNRLFAGVDLHAKTHAPSDVSRRIGSAIGREIGEHQDEKQCELSAVDRAVLERDVVLEEFEHFSSSIPIGTGSYASHVTTISYPKLTGLLGPSIVGSLIRRGHAASVLRLFLADVGVTVRDLVSAVSRCNNAQVRDNIWRAHGMRDIEALAECDQRWYNGKTTMNCVVQSARSEYILRSLCVLDCTTRNNIREGDDDNTVFHTYGRRLQRMVSMRPEHVAIVEGLIERVTGNATRPVDVYGNGLFFEGTTVAFTEQSVHRGELIDFASYDLIGRRKFAGLSMFVDRQKYTHPHMMFTYSAEHAECWPAAPKPRSVQSALQAQLLMRQIRCINSFNGYGETFAHVISDQDFNDRFGSFNQYGKIIKLFRANFGNIELAQRTPTRAGVVGNHGLSVYDALDMHNPPHTLTAFMVAGSIVEEVRSRINLRTMNTCDDTGALVPVFPPFKDVIGGVLAAAKKERREYAAEHGTPLAQGDKYTDREKAVMAAAKLEERRAGHPDAEKAKAWMKINYAPIRRKELVTAPRAPRAALHAVEKRWLSLGKATWDAEAKRIAKLPHGFTDRRIREPFGSSSDVPKGVITEYELQQIETARINTPMTAEHRAYLERVYASIAKINEQDRQRRLQRAIANKLAEPIVAAKRHLIGPMPKLTRDFDVEQKLHMEEEKMFNIMHARRVKMEMSAEEKAANYAKYDAELAATAAADEKHRLDCIAAAAAHKAAVKTHARIQREIAEARDVIKRRIAAKKRAAEAAASERVMKRELAAQQQRQADRAQRAADDAEWEAQMEIERNSEEAQARSKAAAAKMCAMSVADAQAAIDKWDSKRARARIAKGRRDEDAEERRLAAREARGAKRVVKTNAAMIRKREDAAVKAREAEKAAHEKAKRAMAAAFADDERKHAIRMEKRAAKEARRLAIKEARELAAEKQEELAMQKKLAKQRDVRKAKRAAAKKATKAAAKKAKKAAAKKVLKAAEKAAADAKRTAARLVADAKRAAAEEAAARLAAEEAAARLVAEAKRAAEEAAARLVAEAKRAADEAEETAARLVAEARLAAEEESESESDDDSDDEEWDADAWKAEMEAEEAAWETSEIARIAAELKVIEDEDAAIAAYDAADSIRRAARYLEEDNAEPIVFTPDHAKRARNKLHEFPRELCTCFYPRIACKCVLKIPLEM